MTREYRSLMWVKQCHKPSPSHHYFHRWHKLTVPKLGIQKKNKVKYPYGFPSWWMLQWEKQERLKQSREKCGKLIMNADFRTRNRACFPTSFCRFTVYN